MSRNNPDKPSAGPVSRPFRSDNYTGFFVRNMLMITLISVFGKEVSAKSNLEDISKNHILQKNNYSEAVGESGGDITLDTLEKKGEIIKRIEGDLEKLKIICARFKSAGRFTKSDIRFINELMDDYQLKKTKDPRNNLISILDYHEKNFSEYYNILVELLTDAQILNGIECKGCYEDGIKTFFNAAKLYRSKQLEVKQLREGI
jgi:hypothetical protein